MRRGGRTRIVWWYDDGEGGRLGAFASFDDARAGDPSAGIGWQEVSERRARWLLAQGPEVAW